VTRGEVHNAEYGTVPTRCDTNVKYNKEPSKTGVPQNAPVGSWRAGMQHLVKVRIAVCFNSTWKIASIFNKVAAAAVVVVIITAVLQ